MTQDASNSVFREQRIRFGNINLQLTDKFLALRKLLFQEFNEQFTCLVFAEFVALLQHKKDVVR